MRIVDTLKMNDVLNHPLGGPRPWALDSANAGLQRLTCPKDHHLPRSRSEDGSRYDSSVMRANYRRSDNGPEDKRQRENNW